MLQIGKGGKQVLGGTLMFQLGHNITKKYHFKITNQFSLLQNHFKSVYLNDLVPKRVKKKSKIFRSKFVIYYGTCLKGTWVVCNVIKPESFIAD